MTLPAAPGKFVALQGCTSAVSSGRFRNELQTGGMQRCFSFQKILLQLEIPPLQRLGELGRVRELPVSQLGSWSVSPVLPAVPVLPVLPFRRAEGATGLPRGSLPLPTAQPLAVAAEWMRRC